ncbi:helix-turn-helix domain-containing protein [Pararhodobacter sp. CCB-MM2]|uniref:helix-turn-helix domain-containing protein n=1 Tax=Pararhodobacter sp. CCB-MM2 TaxID=1786003 RepID=UPI00082C5BC6|nr:cupin domain-containing protein [Pararhodobacter sp. CCB-MM2]MCA2011111.1 cupin domain-containing protein [Cereibacter sphaeroides]
MARPKPQTDPNLGSRIRKRRKQMGLTLQQLCDMAGLSAGFLSQVERGLATPSLGTLAQIAQGLGLGIEHFVGGTRPSDALTRASERRQFSIEGSQMGYEPLGASFPGAELSSYLLHIPPGYVSETVSHEGEEIIFLLEGEIVKTLGAETFVLREGDSLHFSGTTPHSWANQTDTTARLLWTGTLPVLKGREVERLPELIPEMIPEGLRATSDT